MIQLTRAAFRGNEMAMQWLELFIIESNPVMHKIAMWSISVSLLSPVHFLRVIEFCSKVTQLHTVE